MTNYNNDNIDLWKMLQLFSQTYSMDNKCDKITIPLNKTDDICCICHEKLINAPAYDSLHQLICGHLFHKQCIYEWIYKYCNVKCPLCNKDCFNQQT